jgi:hypothetical protein
MMQMLDSPLGNDDGDFESVLSNNNNNNSNVKRERERVIVK